MIWSHWKGWKGEESGVRYCDDSSLYVYDGGDSLAFIGGCSVLWLGERGVETGAAVLVSYILADDEINGVMS